MYLATPQTSPVFTALLLEPFLETQMYINSFFSYLSISIFKREQSFIQFLEESTLRIFQEKLQIYDPF